MSARCVSSSFGSARYQQQVGGMLSSACFRGSSGLLDELITSHRLPLSARALLDPARCVIRQLGFFCFVFQLHLPLTGVWSASPIYALSSRGNVLLTLLLCRIRCPVLFVTDGTARAAE